jgi:pSer/pThr/pTyr-binding forkhead associated (FHA) protein
MDEQSTSAARFPLLEPPAPRISLSVIRGPGQGATVSLRRVLTIIGTREGCKVRLRHPDVSPVHCAILYTGFDLFVRDLISDRKTYLNDLPVECEPLGKGDVLRIAEWEFLVEVDSSVVAEGTHADNPVQLEPSQTIALQIANNGQLVKLSREVAVVGRRPGCDVLLQNPRVSRAHALIASVSGQPTVFNLLSENGLSYEGESVWFSPLASGGVLEVGPATLRVVIPDGVAKAPAKTDIRGATATTVIPLEDDDDDKVDIRAAELNP